METLLPGITLERVPTSRLTVGRAVGHRADRGAGAVRARQRVVLAVLAADHARAARARTGRWRWTCAASARPTRNRWTRPAGSATTPTTWPPHRGAGAGLGPPGGLEHGRRRGAAVPRRPARRAPRRVRDPGRPGLPVRVRRDPGVDGILCDPYGAGSGGGSANPDFVARLAGRDRSADSPTSPRQVLLAHYVKPPFVPEHLDIFVESMLSTRTGDDHYPGNSPQVPDWPGFAPGDRGVLNTMAPTHFRITGLSARSPSRRCCGCAARTTSSSRTPRCTTSPTWARSAPCPAGRGAGLAAAADGGADPRRAGRLRRGRQALPRGRDPGRRPRPAPGPAGAVPGRADRPSGRGLT